MPFSPLMHIMKKRFSLLALLAACALPPALAQPGPGFVMPDAPGWRPATLVAAQERVLHSRHTGRDYRIQIATNGSPPAGGYPVIYVLDGDNLFPVLAMLIQEHQYRSDPSGALAVVGVGYPGGQLLDLKARARDYTPPMAADVNADAVDAIDADSERFGGAALFRRFLQEELKPEIARVVKVDPAQQALMGHSFGGLYALHALLAHPGDWRYYFISSPSIWWGNKRVLQEENTLPARLAALKGEPPLVRLTVGELEEKPLPKSATGASSDKAATLEAQRARHQQERRMVSESRALARRLAAMPGLHVEFHEYPGQTHGSVIFPAMNDNLRVMWRELAAAARQRTQAD